MADVALNDEEPGLALIVQAAPDRPVCRGVGDDGKDLLCASCEEVVLLENVPANAVFDLEIQCAGCGAVTPTPARPPGRGLGGVLHPVLRSHRAVGTFVMDMDEVIVGERAMRTRARETGGDLPERVPKQLDPAAIQEIIDDARSTFGPILTKARPAKHRLARLIALAEENLAALQAGGKTIDVFSILELARATGAFQRWAHDPSTDKLIQDSKDPNTFDHNSALLQVGRMLEHARLGPEFVPTGDGKSPDLVLRISSTRWIQVDTKALRGVQRPPDGATVKLVEPRDTIRRALKKSRGQFDRPGILVLAGNFWVGGIDAYAAAASKLLSEPLAGDASAEAKKHYGHLLGIMFASVGWDVQDRTYKDRLYLRWVPNPHYLDSIDLTLPPDVDGPFTITFRRSSEPFDVGEHQAESDSEGSPTYESQPFDPARFRLIADDEVEAEGAIRNGSPDGRTERIVVFCFPEGYRPPMTVDFDVTCEGGFTVVTVNPDGSLLADPTVGWIRLHGVRFKTSGIRDQEDAPSISAA